MISRFTFIVFGFFFLLNQGMAQTDSVISRIRTDFKKWQPIIDTEIGKGDKLYNYAWGENYKFDKWIRKEQNLDSLTLSYKVSIIDNDKLGYYVNIENYSFSGDWFIIADYYYDTDEKLYFVFWRLRTFFADEPVRVEKRLYFDSDGEKVRELKKVYKMDSNEKFDSDFMDKSVDYKLDINDWDFFKLWIQH